MIKKFNNFTNNEFNIQYPLVRHLSLLESAISILENGYFMSRNELKNNIQKVDSNVIENKNFNSKDKWWDERKELENKKFGSEDIIYCIPDWFKPVPLIFNTACPRILQVGTTENKNIERVAAALSNVNCQWIIIGRLSPAQRAVIESHGIDYENHVGLSEETLLEQYKLADMLVFASTYEGFGLPIVEANAVGRPVVTSNLYSMPEVAGNAACLVGPYSIVSIRAGILKVIEDADYRESLVRAGFINAERFRPTVIAEQYVQLYRRIYSKQNS